MHLFKAAIFPLLKFIGAYKFCEFGRETLVFISYQVKKNPFTVPKACTRWKTKRSISIILFFRADKYTVAEEILVNKYNCTKVKLRASVGETQSSHCQRIMPLPRRMTQNVSDAI